MATFSTNTNVETRFAGGAAQLAQLTKATPYSTAKVDSAREQAHAWIRGVIARRYEIPTDLSGHPVLAALLREHELNLVEELLWSTCVNEVPPAVADKAKRTRDYFQQVADGKAELPSASELPTSDARGTAGKVVGSERVFTRETMEGTF